MSGIHSSRLILLDLQNEHEAFDLVFDSSVFSRFNDRNKCLEYISSRLSNSRLLHFFIPQCEHLVINDNPTFLNTIYYIYCTDKAITNEMKQQYDYPMFIKIFDTKTLSDYLHQAAISDLIEHAERRKHEPDEHDIALLTAAEFSNLLANQLNEYMNEKLG